MRPVPLTCSARRGGKRKTFSSSAPGGLTGKAILSRQKNAHYVTIVYPVRTAASHVAKRGSNPLGDASARTGPHRKMRPFCVSASLSEEEEEEEEEDSSAYCTRLCPSHQLLELLCDFRGMRISVFALWSPLP